MSENVVAVPRQMALEPNVFMQGMLPYQPVMSATLHFTKITVVCLLHKLY